jgi:hypothetical protein
MEPVASKSIGNSPLSDKDELGFQASYEWLETT